MGSRLGAEAEAETGKTDRDDVDDRFSRILENGGRMSQEPGCGFPGEHGKAEDERETHGELRGLHLFWVPGQRRSFNVVAGHFSTSGGWVGRQIRCAGDPGRVKG